MSPARSMICKSILFLCIATLGSFAQTTTPFKQPPSQVQPTSAAVPLTLQKAIDLALQNNLSVLLSRQSTRATRGERLRALSQVLPNVTSGVSEHLAQDNFAITGLQFP